uniref:Uncharacterized protein n=1 Tax=Helianthus annuus TaxID=4232 RepID=A0A251TEF9_HELAN
MKYLGYFSASLPRSLIRANEEYPVVNFERYLNSILSHQHPARPVPELTKYLDAIDKMVSIVVHWLCHMRNIYNIVLHR